MFYTYRGKGGKRGRRELPRPAYEAICAALADRGLVLTETESSTPLWDVTGATFYQRFRRYLRKAAKLRRDVGERVETVSAFLDHSTLATTTVYLRRLEGQRDDSWVRVAEAIGA